MRLISLIITFNLTGLIFGAEGGAEGGAESQARKSSMGPEIYISLSMSPERLRISKTSVIEKILRVWGEGISGIFINLPKQFRNQEPYPEEIIESLSQLEKVIIQRQELDLGPIMKLIPTVKYMQSKRFNPKNTIIIVMDDDMLPVQGGSKAFLAFANEAIKTCSVSSIMPQYTYGFYPVNLTLYSRKHLEYFEVNDYFHLHLDEIFYGKSLAGTTLEKITNRLRFVVGAHSYMVPLHIITEERLEELEEWSQISEKTKMSDDFVVSFALSKWKVSIRSFADESISVNENTRNFFIFDEDLEFVPSALMRLDGNEQARYKIAFEQLQSQYKGRK